MTNSTPHLAAINPADALDMEALATWPLPYAWAQWQSLRDLADRQSDHLSEMEASYEALAHLVPATVQLDAGMVECKKLVSDQVRGTAEAQWITSAGWRQLASIAKARGLLLDEVMAERFAAATAAFESEPSEILTAADNLALAAAAWEETCCKRDLVSDVLHYGKPETLDDLRDQMSYLAHFANGGLMIDGERACEVFIQAARVLGDPELPEPTA